jgi:hypothetical protein
MFKETKVSYDNGFYSMKEYEDFELVNPIEFIKNMCFESSKSFDRNILLAKGFTNPSERVLIKYAKKRCNKKIKSYRQTKFPKALIKLLNAKSKREQVKLLKGLSFNHKQFYSFIFYAFENYGYRLSQYKAKHNHNGFDVSNMPTIAHIEKDGSVTKVGKTELSDGQLKQAIEHRKVTVSKFLDNENGWHCFFLTLKSLAGKEKHNNGKPHFHYISDKWNLERKDVIEQLTSKKYSLPSLPHIGFRRH